MFRLNDVAMLCHRSIFWVTPYRTGNLARNGIGDLRSFGQNSVGFYLFGVGTEYGVILNEQQVIHYRIQNQHTGQTYSGSYNNRHYKWVDRFADQFANDLPVNFPGLRRTA